MQSVSGGGYLLNKSLASYQETKKFNVIEGTVKYEGSGDVYVAAYIDGVHTSGNFPDRQIYAFDYAECNNEAEITFNKEIWKANVSNVGSDKTKCNVYFITRDQKKYISNKIKYFAESDTTNLAYDGTVDNNLRYIGANPNNYVIFNGELWRIIGVFNNIDDGTGKFEWRTKIIRNETIGKKAWNTVNVIDWNATSLNTELNGSYLNGLSGEAKQMIGNTKWNLGKSSFGINSFQYYAEEREGETWLGKIGLMYPSDYGYAVGGASRATCLNISMYDWNSQSECYNNDWLFNGLNQWTITASTATGSFAFGISSKGYIFDYDVRNTTLVIYPALYLSSNVALVGGSGISTDPYQLSYE